MVERQPTFYLFSKYKRAMSSFIFILAKAIQLPFVFELHVLFFLYPFVISDLPHASREYK